MWICGTHFKLVWLIFPKAIGINQSGLGEINFQDLQKIFLIPKKYIFPEAIGINQSGLREMDFQDLQKVFLIPKNTYFRKPLASLNLV